MDGDRFHFLFCESGCDCIMKILDILHKDTILLDLMARDKKGAIEEMVRPVADIAGLDYRELVRVLMERERLGSTGIGGGIAIPHGKLKGLKKLMLGFGRSTKGVSFESIDGKPAHIFFLLLTPEDAIDVHLKMLARISRILRNEIFRTRLEKAASPEDILSAIRQEDEIS